MNWEDECKVQREIAEKYEDRYYQMVALNQQLEAEVALERTIRHAFERAVLGEYLTNEEETYGEVRKVCELRQKAELWDWWIEHIEEIELSKTSYGWDIDFRGVAYNGTTIIAAVKAAREVKG